VDTAPVCRPRACSVRRAPPAVICADKEHGNRLHRHGRLRGAPPAPCRGVRLARQRALEDEFVAGGAIMDVYTTYDAVNQLEFLLYLAAYIVTCMWLWAVRRNARGAEPDCASRA
jgi:hypothetical protein